MLAGALITLREGMEAFLVVGILPGYLRRMRVEQFRKYVWWGTAGIVVFSIALTLIMQAQV